MADSNPHALATVGRALYCRHCGYNLRGLAVMRCPECGRPFDPAKPRTYRRGPFRPWLRHVRRAAIASVAIPLLLAATWLWFYWGWHTEQQALARYVPRPNYVIYAPLVSPALRHYAGRAGFVLDRAQSVQFVGRPDVTDLSPIANLHYLTVFYADATGIHDLAPLAHLTRLETVSLCSNGPADLTPLAGLVSLRQLWLGGVKATDIRPLAGLTRLEYLALNDTGVTDLAPLAGLTNLRELILDDTPLTDLRPICHLPKLERLHLRKTQISDPAPLASLTALRDLYLPGEMISEAQAQVLQDSVPACHVYRLVGPSLLVFPGVLPTSVPVLPAPTDR